MSSLDNLKALPMTFYYKDDTQNGIRIKIKNNDDQMELFSNLFNKSKWLKINSRLNSDFNRIFAFLSDGRYGKSILRTSLVETVSQHSSDEMVPGYEYICLISEEFIFSK